MSKQKKLNPNLQPEKQGLIHLQAVVNEMGCVWRPTPNDDLGLDGEIEIFDAGQPRGLVIKVQCKSGMSYISNARFGKFDFYAREKDLLYWKDLNVPVLVLVYDPEIGAMYWKHIQGYVYSHPAVMSKPHVITFSRRSDAFDRSAFVRLCSLVIKDEAELTEFLKDKLHESIRSNWLAATEMPNQVFHFSLSMKACTELSEAGLAFPEEELARGDGGFWSFCNPAVDTFRAKGWIDLKSITVARLGDFLAEKRRERVFVELFNKGLRAFLKSRGLLHREKGSRFYFPPEECGSPRAITWQATTRTATRQVAYPYISNRTGAIAFWVHHALRARLRCAGSQWSLQIEPGYVFTRDGLAYVAAEQVGRLTTRKVSIERNEQVLNHLLFWSWFLRGENSSIYLPCGDQHFEFEAEYVGGGSSFGIPLDRKRIVDLLETTPDIDWGELEEGFVDDREEE